MKVNCLNIFLSLLMFSCGCKSDEIYVENRRILNIDISNVNNPLNDTIPYKIYGINLKIIDTVLSKYIIQTGKSKCGGYGTTYNFENSIVKIEMYSDSIFVNKRKGEVLNEYFQWKTSNYIPIDLQNVTNFNQGGLLLLKPNVAPVINKNYNFILKATLNNNLVLTDTIHKVFLK